MGIASIRYLTTRTERNEEDVGRMKKDLQRMPGLRRMKV